MALPVSAESSSFAGTKVLGCDNRESLGSSTVATKAFAAGDVIFKEPPLALVYPADDSPWLKTMRAELEKESQACAWQLCVAVHCLLDKELPKPIPLGLTPMHPGARRKMEDLCGVDYPEDLEPSELAVIAVRHLTAASGAKDVYTEKQRRDLERTLDILGARVSRNGFQIMDLSRRPPTSADGLFHRISFCNHCCAGLNNASWTWDGVEGLLSLKASRDIAEGEDLTISYIAKPWCDLAKPARQRYLQQNFNFTCLCKACNMSAEEVGDLKKQHVVQSNGDKKAKPSGKLANLLVRWMQEGGEASFTDSNDKADDESDSKQTKSDIPPRKSAGPLTDADRLERVLARCRKEEVEVSENQAKEALEAEDGHVGKTFIRLRKQQSQATEDGSTEPLPKSSAEFTVSRLDHGATLISPSLAVVCAAAFATVALGVIVMRRRR